MADALRLTSAERASFVAQGYLRCDDLVPPALCTAALAELAGGSPPSPYGAAAGRPETRWPGRPLGELWHDSPAIGPIMRLPRLEAVITDLLGPGALYDHHYAHVIPPRQRWSQPWHADAILDTRPLDFDIQLFFFFHDTPREAGGTMILPASHLRRVNESDICRTQNFRGQLPTICRAGTVLVCHHGIWHCGQPNHGDRPRTMLKVRLGPAMPQGGLWAERDRGGPPSTGAGAPGVAGERARAEHGEVVERLRAEPPWMGSAEARLEIVKRIKLWRHLTGDVDFDVDHWLTRMRDAGPRS